MAESLDRQHAAFESNFDLSRRDEWGFHYTTHQLTRYLRDRRLHLALDLLERVAGLRRDELRHWSALVVCGGVGGEATFLANQGFTDVTNSDFSENALQLCRAFDPRLNTKRLNAEAMELPDASVDLVLVQDGLHHLPRPVQGLTEMVRVARRAVIVLEPHTGLVAKILGTTWERIEDETNFVFRWNHAFLNQVVRSYLLDGPHYVRGLRVWDHNSAVGRVVTRLPERWRLGASRLIYAILGLLLPRAGNQLIGLVVKDNPEAVTRGGFGPPASGRASSGH